MVIETVKEIQEFFVDDHRMRERQFKPLEACGSGKARKLIEKASEALGPKAK